MKALAAALFLAAAQPAPDAALNTFLKTDWKPAARLAELPAPLQRQVETFMSEPGSPFSGGVAPPGQKRQRMFLAGLAGNRAFIAYEQGGIAYRRVLALYRIDGDSVVEEGRWDLRGVAASIPELKADLGGAKR